jgi:hypothetical protein
MTLRLSRNDGVSWDEQFTVYTGPAGYSVLGVLGNQDVVLLYERAQCRIPNELLSPA